MNDFTNVLNNHVQQYNVANVQNNQLNDQNGNAIAIASNANTVTGGKQMHPQFQLSNANFDHVLPPLPPLIGDPSMMGLGMSSFGGVIDSVNLAGVDPLMYIIFFFCIFIFF